MWGKHKVYLVINDVWKEKISKAYNRSWLEEIDNNMIDFTHKTAK